jgi:hypothetical protein
VRGFKSLRAYHRTRPRLRRGDGPATTQPLTVICPFMPGWKVQWYWYVPGVVNCTCHVSPCCNVPEVSAD